MYKNYIFDLYGTLVDINTNEENPLIWDKLSLFYSYNNAPYKSFEIKGKYNELIKKHISMANNIDHPDFPIEYIFEELYLLKNVSPTAELVKNTSLFFRILSIDKLNLYNGVIKLLEALKLNNKKVYLLTNAQKVFTSYEINLLGLTNYFDDILYSSESKVCKPNKLFYNELISKHNLNVNETIMIGNDYFCDIEPSLDLGLDTLYIHSNISPVLENPITSTYKILDGDFLKVKSLILK
ncbi:MAG: HAD family hydrolase [Clostridium sp.]|uniref:HAD family hydrolase n=1 Tax=Clostridium sp. TaxID=1506 RepID=UPI0025C0E7E8|nr:HAD family hydrolase [Clostridium sp.]MCF0147664.1 HAD family hydrolase [Clostridium sp.]